MKKIILMVFAALCVSVAMAQDEEGGIVNKNGYAILPQAGDIAVGADATPYLNYLGNMLNGTSNNGLYLGDYTLFGKYYLTDETAVRLRLSWYTEKDLNRNYIRDDAAFLADPLSNAQTVDKQHVYESEFEIGVGYEMHRGRNRLQGFWGVEVGAGTGKYKETYEYGNPMVVANPAPTSYGSFYNDYWGTGGNLMNGGLERILEFDEGRSSYIGAGAFIGVEYFFLPSICIGGDLSLMGHASWNSQGKYTYESVDAAGNVNESLVPMEPGDRDFGIMTFRPAPFGELYLLFHF